MGRKYRNTPTVVNGITFDSKKEASRWWQLNVLLKAGEISDLQRQVRYKLVVNGLHICTYIPDFVYSDRGQRIVEDVKSPVTAKNPVYRIKKKLMKAVHGVEVREV